MDEWCWQAIEALATVAAVVVAAFAVKYAWRAAERQRGVAEGQREEAEGQRKLTARLLQIEEDRDRPRMVVLANPYREVGQEREPDTRVLVYVANIGAAPGGPVRVAVFNDEGEDVTYVNSDPVLVKPGEIAPCMVDFPGVDGEHAFMDDDERRGGDMPEGVMYGTWVPVEITRGYYIRAWDPMIGRSSWYPRKPPKEPPDPIWPGVPPRTEESPTDGGLAAVSKSE